MKKHTYLCDVEWTGNDGEGTKTYKSYRRDHVITSEGKPPIPASSDPSFSGDKERYNPEELLVAALSSCHMLWYLHLCAVNKIIAIPTFLPAHRAYNGVAFPDGFGSGKRHGRSRFGGRTRCSTIIALSFGILSVVRMIWWFLIVAVAAGAVLWAALAAYVWVRQRLRNAENRPADPEQPQV